MLVGCNIKPSFFFRNNNFTFKNVSNLIKAIKLFGRIFDENDRVQIMKYPHSEIISGDRPKSGIAGRYLSIFTINNIQYKGSRLAAGGTRTAYAYSSVHIIYA